MMDRTLPLGVIEGRGAFTETVRRMLLGLPDAGPREVWFIDNEFDAWPLDEDVVLDALTAWSRPSGRKLRIVGNDFRLVQLRYPRFAAWRRPRMHLIEAWQPTPEDHVDLSAALLAGTVALELLDAKRWRAREVLDRAALRSLQENVATLLHRCQSAWPSTTLGL